MLNLITAAASYVFPGARALKLVRNGVNLTNTSNPLIISKNVTLVVLDCCAPPPVRLVGHCLAAGSLVFASVVAPNPVTVGSAIHVVAEIYENC